MRTGRRCSERTQQKVNVNKVKDVWRGLGGIVGCKQTGSQVMGGGDSANEL